MTVLAKRTHDVPGWQVSDTGEAMDINMTAPVEVVGRDPTRVHGTMVGTARVALILAVCGNRR
jgi:hypothetical protein